jgi:hypothetical protein
MSLAWTRRIKEHSHWRMGRRRKAGNFLLFVIIVLLPMPYTVQSRILKTQSWKKLYCPRIPLPGPAKFIVPGKSVLNYAHIMRPDEQPSPEQIAALRAIPGDKRLRLAERLYWSARKIKAAGIRYQHPDWPEDRVNAEVTKIFLHARS